MAVVDTEVRRTLHSEIESATAKLVFLSLAQEGRATVADLQERLGEPRIRLYGVLDSLAERGVIDSRRSDAGTVYVVDE